MFSLDGTLIANVLFIQLHLLVEKKTSSPHDVYWTDGDRILWTVKPFAYSSISEEFVGVFPEKEISSAFLQCKGLDHLSSAVKLVWPASKKNSNRIW